MGQTLSEPIVEKHTSSGKNDRLIFGMSSMQGWRLTMEDAHTALLQLPNTEKPFSFFAVYDGHGGERVAKYASEHVFERLVAEEDFKNGNYNQALINSFIQTDADILNNPTVMEERSGATAVTCLITDTSIICANAGDSRCILSTKCQAIPLSNDHKPTVDTEFQRITAAGGFVEYERVNGNLALSRAFGDFDYKKNPNLGPEAQIVSCYPEIITYAISPDVDFIVLACDGIWDCMTNQEVAEFIHARVSEGKELHSICEEMMDSCLSSDSMMGKVGCDNMSVIIVAFLHGKSYEDWCTYMRTTLKLSAPKSPDTNEGIGQQ